MVCAVVCVCVVICVCDKSAAGVSASIESITVV